MCDGATFPDQICCSTLPFPASAPADIGQSEHIDIRTKIGAVAPTGVHDTACRALQLPDLLVPSA